jgi:hypothetical protein
VGGKEKGKREVEEGKGMRGEMWKGHLFQPKSEAATIKRLFLPGFNNLICIMQFLAF